MSYKGETYRIPCIRGGFNYNPNIDDIPPEAMVEPSRNINLHEGGRGKRGGTSKVNGTAVSGSPRIMGLIDFILRNDNQFQVFGTNDGKIYKNSTTTIKTGLGLNKYSNFTVFNNTLYHTNQNDTVQTWDGAAAGTSDLANPATDWGAGDQPAQLIVHGRGNSERLWAFNSPDQPQNIYYSADGSANFATGGTIPIETGDGSGIVGGVDFQDNLLAFGRRKSFIIDDTSATVSDWGYTQAAWNNGVAHHRLICKTENDVLCFTTDGDIYSILAVQETGDYKAASIARPAFIDRWIRNNCKLSEIAQFHSIYDPIRRAALFFLVSNGSNMADICLPFFIDRTAIEAWGAPMTSATACGYHASCAALVQKSLGNNKIYTGDGSGFLWELETANANDDSAAYDGKDRGPELSLDNPALTKHFHHGAVVMEPEGNFNLNVKKWIDGTELTEQTISMAGTGGVLDNFVLDTDVLGGEQLIDSSYPIGAYGKRIKQEHYNNNVNESFFISQKLIHFKPLGVKAS